MDRSSLVTVSALLLVASVGLGSWLSAGGQQGSPDILVLEQNSGRTVLDVTVPGLEVVQVSTDQGEYTRLELPGEVFAVLEQGRPQVPKVSMLLAIPTGAGVRARAEVLETRTFKVSNVYPLQPPLLDGQEPGPLVLDKEFYEDDVLYPQPDARLVETGVWRDFDVANLQLYPVKVNPGLGEVVVATRVRVELEYSGGTYPSKVADWMVPQYARMLDNFGHLRVQPLTDYTAGVRYLVFCHQNWATNTWLHDSLLGWVKKRGYDLRVVTKSSFTAQEIKDSIKAEYDNHTPALLRHVLLVGEYAEIPMGSYTGVGRSDFWYTDLEPSGGDNYPELSLGRLSPDSAGCLTNQVKKILKYQKDPPSTNDWLTRLTMNAHREQYPAKYSGCIRGVYNMPKPYYDFDTDTIMGEYEGNQAVFDAMHAGTGYMIYRGHGSGTAWTGWCGSDWDVSTTYQLANGDLTPVTHHFACICGDINIGTCLTEAWMRKYPGGAVSALGATQASYTYPNHGQCSTVVRAVADTWTITVPGVRDYAGPVFDVGGIMGYMDAYIAKYWPEDPYPRNIYMYLTLGDPSTPAWSGGMPQTATVNYPGAVPVGSYSLNVGVSVGGRPVQGALVCAWKQGEFYVAERTTSAGTAVLSINALTPGQFSVTVSEGHAASGQHTPIIPYQGTCMAQAAGVPYVMYLRHTIDDSAGGNNDGSVNPGETINMPMWVKNWGDSTARSLVVKLRTGDGFITVTDSAKSLGDVPGRDSAYTGMSGFEFEVAVGCTNGHLAVFDVEARDGDDSVWMSNAYVRVGAPNLAYMNYQVIDTLAGGNGNGRLDPNETAELMVTLKNTGFGNANSVTAVLKSGDARMTVTDSSGSFGQIMADSMAMNVNDRFVVVTRTMPPETEIPCTLFVSGAGGYAKTLSFELRVGEIRAVDPIPDGPRRPSLYWAYDDADSAYEQAPRYDWVEINGVGTRITYSHNDAVVMVELPPAFGPFYFYGQRYTQLSISADGWICPGNYTTGDYSNTRLPDPSTPPGMICVNWDDLYPVSGSGGAGYVYYYHDEANHRFVVEYDSVRYFSGTVRDKFEVIFYDTTVVAFEGDNAFVAQYMTANRYSSTTVGIEDPEREIAIQCLFDGDYHRGCAGIAPGRAIKYTTDGPVTAVADQGFTPSQVPRELALAVAPNPFRSASVINWQLPVPGVVRLGVYDVSGRVVRNLVQGGAMAGTYHTAWDGRDDNGRTVPNGTYLYKLETSAGIRTTKAVKLK
jgi:hypothetical protein